MNILNELFVIARLIYFQFKQIFPYWLAGVLVGSIFSVYVKNEITLAASCIRNGRLILVGLMVAALLGAASPLCMYGTIPVIAALGKRGVPQHYLAAFMVTSILINPNLLIFSFALGTSMALLRLFVCIFMGILAGILVYGFFRNRELFDYSGFQGEEKCRPKGKGIRIFLGDVNRGIQKTAPYFFIGILLAALFDKYFPQQWVVGLFGNNKGLGVLMASILGVPIYVCGGGTIPLLKSWLNIGMSSGSAIAFMITGPATKLTNLSAVKIILGLKNFVIYITFIMLMGFGVGLFVDMMNGLIH